MSENPPNNNGAKIHEFTRLPGIGAHDSGRDTCADCVFFQIQPQNLGQGVCHGNPPQAMLIQGANGQHSAMSFYPPVSAKEIACRHFKDASIRVE